MLTIGQFSRVSRVTIKALRYYDDIGLFVPARVDSFTGYRYYAVDQLPRLHRILALRDLGLSLDQITRVLDEQVGIEELRGMLRLKQAELEQHITIEQARLAAVAVRLSQIEREGPMTTYDVVIKDVPAVPIAAHRAIISSYAAVNALYGTLFPYLARFGEAGLCGAIWYDDGYKEIDVDAEVFVVLGKPVPEADGIEVRELPAGKVASLIHQGGYDGLSAAYSVLFDWIAHHGHTVLGRSRELYLQVPEVGGLQDDPNCVTELQVPIA